MKRDRVDFELTAFLMAAWGAELQDFAKHTSEAAEFDDEEEEESEDEDEDVGSSAADVQLSWLFANGTIGCLHDLVSHGL